MTPQVGSFPELEITETGGNAGMKTALILRPPEDLHIGHTEKNPDELERVYQIGRQEAEKHLSEIRLWLKG